MKLAVLRASWLSEVYGMNVHVVKDVQIFT